MLAVVCSMELKIGQKIKLRSVNFPGHFVSRQSNGRVAISDSGVGNVWVVRSGLAGKGISLESISGGYIRHRNFEAWVDPQTNQDLYKNDASFTVEEGAAGKGVSFRSVNFPERLLRHAGYVMWIHQSDGSDLYRKDASFEVVEVEPEEPVKCWRKEDGYRLMLKKIRKGTLDKVKKFCADNKGVCSGITCKGKSCKAVVKQEGKVFHTHLYVC